VWLVHTWLATVGPTSWHSTHCFKSREKGSKSASAAVLPQARPAIVADYRPVHWSRSDAHHHPTPDHLRTQCLEYERAQWRIEVDLRLLVIP
jgi:hypothetical protein